MRRRDRYKSVLVALVTSIALVAGLVPTQALAEAVDELAAQAQEASIEAMAIDDLASADDAEKPAPVAPAEVDDPPDGEAAEPAPAAPADDATTQDDDEAEVIAPAEPAPTGDVGEADQIVPAESDGSQGSEVMDVEQLAEEAGEAAETNGTEEEVAAPPAAPALGVKTVAQKAHKSRGSVTNPYNSGSVEFGYSVTFDANVPANASTACAGSMGDQSFASGETKVLTANGYSLPGYDLKGWSTKADGSGASYADGAEVQNLTDAGGTWDVEPRGARISTTFTFTYAFDAEQEVYGVVEWNDNNNESGERPEKITVRLMANGAESRSMEVAGGAYDLWAFSFDKLPPRDPQGNEIVYSVTADEVPGYTVEVVHGGGNAYRITYTRPTPVKPTLTITAKDQKYTYNGQIQGEGDTAYEDPAQIAEKVTVEGLLEGDELTSVVLDGQGQEVGEHTIEVTGFSIDNNPGARDKYDVVLVPGKLTIKPAEATIAVNSASKVAGETDPTFTGAIEGLVAEGDLGEVRYVRTNDDEAPGTYAGVLTATYDENPNYDVNVAKGDFTIRALYTLRWLDGDESVLQEKTYVEGEPAPVYDGRDPSKAATAQYTYAFTSWDGGTVEGAVTTYRPLFSETVNEYTVKFVNDDGTELQSGKVAYGETPEYTGATPEKPATTQHTYAFKGWSPEVVAVTGDATYTATYDEIPVVATLTFDPAGGTIDGKTSLTIEANVGDVIAIPKAPVRVGYEFRYWRGSEYHPRDEYTVEGDHTFTAVWEREVEPVTETFTVTFDANGHGAAPAAQEVESGKAAMRPADPTADGWAFGGWYTDKSCTQAYDFSKPVSGDVTLYAKWTKKASPTPSPDKPEPADPVSPRPSIPQTGDPFAGMLVCVTGLALASGFCLVLAGVGLRRRVGTHRR